VTRAPFAQACMGGWCALRDHCPHFHATFRGAPSERLCHPGQDGFSNVVVLDLRAATTFQPLPQPLEVA
jgi:hypothetical protein